MNNVVNDRDKFIGGSDLPSILGFNLKYGKSVYEFAKEKSGLKTNNFKGNEHTKYGQLMEPIIRDYVNSILHLNFKEDTSIDKENSYRANCDGLDQENNILLEIKTFTGELDIEYYTPQVQFYLELFNIDKCLLVGYMKPNDFYNGINYDLENNPEYFNLEFNPENITIHEIVRDKEYYKALEKSISGFKKAFSLLKDNPTMSEEDFNKEMFGFDLLTLTKEIEKLEMALIGYKTIEKKHKELKVKLYEFFDSRNIKSYDTGIVKITKIDPIVTHKEEINLEKLKSEKPKIFNQYKTEKTVNKSGYLLITTKKEVQENGTTPQK